MTLIISSQLLFTLYIFGSCDRQILNVYSLFRESSTSLHFLHNCTQMQLWGISNSYDPNSIVKHGGNTNIWSTHILHCRFPDLFLNSTPQMCLSVEGIFRQNDPSFNEPISLGAILLDPNLKGSATILCVCQKSLKSKLGSHY